VPKILRVLKVLKMKIKNSCWFSVAGCQKRKFSDVFACSGSYRDYKGKISENSPSFRVWGKAKFQILEIFIIIFLIIAANICFAQNDKLSTKSKKAKEYFIKAEINFNRNNFEQAIIDAENAVRTDTNFFEAYIMLGHLHTNLKNYKLAAASFKKAIKINFTDVVSNYFSLGEAQIFINQYEEAKQNFSKFIELEKNDLYLIEKAKKRIKDCEFSINAIKNPVPFNPVNLGDSINSPFDDYFPTISADGSQLIFNRINMNTNPSRMQDNIFNDDFYISYRINGKWSKARNMGPPVNTLLNEGAQSISPDGHLLIFTACSRKDGFGDCDLYFSRKICNKWSKPGNMGNLINSKYKETQPSIAADGKTIYFVSNRPGGFGNEDIWKIKLINDSTWTSPENLGSTINTPERDVTPFIHFDNKTLYFSSEGHIGMGKLDVYYSKKDSSGKWGTPVNLGYPINTANDESCFILNAAGDTAYYASNRPNGKGRLDIYSFDLYKEARPEMTTYLKGRIFNQQKKLIFDARIELIDLETKQTTALTYSNECDGEFLLCIPTNKNYALNVSKTGYLFYSENFSLKGIHDVANPFLTDIVLEPIEEGQITILKNVFFDFDKFDLKPESIVELDKLKDFLIKNKTIKIEIGGHTDNVGDDKHNQILSENRAKAVYDYLIKNNIAKERLSYKGYGETKPIDTNNTEKGRANNRRTEFKILGK
jgi:outer membrane protein OmpA-like peptidoglycan-associated protein/tetratricopeptide (TPR) repeat protein